MPPCVDCPNTVQTGLIDFLIEYKGKKKMEGMVRATGGNSKLFSFAHSP
eukprot:SAG22_NODE_1765_length_3624_cov_2.026667_4_plen_49_part_00